MLVILSSEAQKLKEKDILGTWKLHINIGEEIEREADDADTMLEEIIIKSVSGMVEGLMDNIEIYFEFQKNNQALITVNAYGETEVEKGRWFINKNGYLELDDFDNNDDGVNIDIDSDDEQWKLVDGLLISLDNLDDRNVYMARVN
jgi:hypothetical protein